MTNCGVGLVVVVPPACWVRVLPLDPFLIFDLISMANMIAARSCAFEVMVEAG